MELSYFYFGEELSACSDDRLQKPVLQNLWQGFCCQGGKLKLDRGPALGFHTENASLPLLPEGREFRLVITPEGIALRGRDASGLVRGFMALLMRIESCSYLGGPGFRVGVCDLCSEYRLQNRMIHFCVFPETTPAFLRKCIRLAGLMQYTHVVLEFWGMLQYDCMKELAWPSAFSRELVSELVTEIRDMGMEAIPMINHLGHAAGSRASGGKHVVLDQAPGYAELFSQDGWSWNLDNPQARELLKKMRRELYEIFGSSEYIHLGFDEVYSYQYSADSQARMARYLHDVLEEVKAEGRRPIIWGDMLLNAQACGVDSVYYCSAETPEFAEKMLSAVPEGTVIADWHYDNVRAPIETSLYLQKRGFDVLGAPWFESLNCQAHVETACRYGTFGIMVTTWHTLAQRMPHIVDAAVQMGACHSPWSRGRRQLETETAALIRRAAPPALSYEDAGWTDRQVFLQARATV